MNIVFIYLKAFSQTGGIEAFNKKFIRALSEIENKNSTTKILSIYDTNKEGSQISNNIEYLGFDGDKIAAFKYLIKHTNKDTIVFYGHINILPFAILLYLMRMNKKAYFIIHGIDVWLRFSFLKRLFLKKFNFLAVSNYTKKVFSEKNNIDLNKTSIFPNCIDLKIKEGPNPNLFDISKFNILTVTRLNPEEKYKGVDSLIKAIPFLLKEIPNIKLTIIGKGEDKGRLFEVAVKLNVLKQVDFKGYVDDLEGYYEHCNVFALPSNGEGFGIVYLEAMKYEKPVIAANSGGVTDVVLNNKTGMLCEYDNIPSLTKTILDIYKSPKKYEVIGNAGLNYLLKNFTFNKFKERLENTLLKINKETF